jgi:hypothetical protein
MTNIVLPPIIKQCFDRALLSRSEITFNPKELMELANYIKYLMSSKKYSKHPNTLNKILIQYNQIKVLYERAKIEKEQRKDKKNKTTFGLFYRPFLSNENTRTVFNRLKRRYRRHPSFWWNHDI